MATDPRKRRLAQIVVTLFVVAAALIGWAGSKGWLGDTGSADPCLDLQGEERAACERMR